MKKNNVFEKYAEEYDEWFDVHPWVYRSEVEAVKMALYMS